MRKLLRKYYLVVGAMAVLGLLGWPLMLAFNVLPPVDPIPLRFSIPVALACWTPAVLIALWEFWEWRKQRSARVRQEPLDPIQPRCRRMPDQP